ncbi:MAG: leucyl aminopeptidase family protein [Planctomycetota bacterium]
MRITAVPSPESAAAARGGFDAVVLVGPTPTKVRLKCLQDALRSLDRADASADSSINMVPAAGVAGGRLVIAPTGPIERDFDDVRRYAEAAGHGVQRARDAGASKILLLVQPASKKSDARYRDAGCIAALGAAGGLWQPLEARESLGEKNVEPVQKIGVAVLGDTFSNKAAKWVEAVEAGVRLTRDLCGTNPERMAPPKFASYVQAACRGTAVKVTVQKDVKKLQKDYPLMMAVARASLNVARHKPCVVRMEYKPTGKIQRTILLAGKGVTYDTGGADLKVGGHMAGMSRDKGGAAAAAGLLLAAAKLGIKGVRLVAELGCVRNSIGADAFVADEIIESHAGCRVRIGNTDAEGRLVLADLLSHLRLDAKKATAPELFTVATLTGHAGKAVGDYNIGLDNGPARSLCTSENLMRFGDLLGDPFEVSRLRREDYDFVAGKTKADDVLQCNNAPSSLTARGHQFPAAFLVRAAGLDEHGNDGDQPLPFTHIDIGGSGCEGGDWQHGKPSGRPVVAMLAALCGALPPSE